MKTLCLYYTRTNTTKAATERLAEIVDADIFAYTDGKDRRGFLGYIGGCLDSFKKTLPQVTIEGSPELSSYDRVVIAMPIWAEGPCVVGRGLIEQYGKDLPEDVYFVVTHMGKGDYRQKLEVLDSLLGRAAKGKLTLRTKDNDYLKEIEDFAKGL